MTVATTTDAKKVRQGPTETLALAKSAARVVVAKGKKIVTFEMTKAPPDDETLLAHLLGPTGNLRAPTVRRGSSLYVGFHDDLYQELIQ